MTFCIGLLQARGKARRHRGGMSPESVTHVLTVNRAALPSIPSKRFDKERVTFRSGARAFTLAGLELRQQVHTPVTMVTIET